MIACKRLIIYPQLLLPLRNIHIDLTAFSRKTNKEINKFSLSHYETEITMMIFFKTIGKFFVGKLSVRSCLAKKLLIFYILKFIASSTLYIIVYVFFLFKTFFKHYGRMAIHSMLWWKWEESSIWKRRISWLTASSRQDFRSSYCSVSS